MEAPENQGITTAMIEPRGRHLIAELTGCDPAILRDPVRIRALLLGSAEAAGVTTVADHVHRFAGGGVTGFVMLAESHISIHTWPEVGYAALDVYTCGDRASPDRACEYLADGLGTQDRRILVLDRGVSTPLGP